jgi:hypothetical protein
MLLGKRNDAALVFDITLIHARAAPADEAGQLFAAARVSRSIQRSSFASIRSVTGRLFLR